MPPSMSTAAAPVAAATTTSSAVPARAGPPAPRVPTKASVQDRQESAKQETDEQLQRDATDQLQRNDQAEQDLEQQQLRQEHQQQQQEQQQLQSGDQQAASKKVAAGGRRRVKGAVSVVPSKKASKKAPLHMATALSQPVPLGRGQPPSMLAVITVTTPRLKAMMERDRQRFGYDLEVPGGIVVERDANKQKGATSSGDEEDGEDDAARRARERAALLAAKDAARRAAEEARRAVEDAARQRALEAAMNRDRARRLAEDGVLIPWKRMTPMERQLELQEAEEASPRSSPRRRS